MLRDIDIFKKITTHLLAQNEKSFTASGSCAYRGVKQSDLNEAWEKAYGSPCPIRIGKINIPGHDLTLSEMNDMLDAIAPNLPTNLMCAVGAVISDEHYHIEIEENSIEAYNVSVLIKLSNPDWKINTCGWAMLAELQKIHDTNSVGDWSSLFSMFEFDLQGNFVRTIGSF